MRILFIDRSTRLKTVHDLDIMPRGGMVQSLFEVSDYLAGRGHDVTVLSDIEMPGLTIFGTRWINNKDILSGKFQAIICNRGTGDGYPWLEAKKRILWTHDLPHSGFIPNPSIMRGFHIVFMSKYAAKVWRTFYPQIGKSTYIPNGVASCFFPRKHKDLKKLIYFSHPNRGLKRLDFIAECIKQKIRGVEVEAYSNVGMYPTDREVLGDYVDEDLPATTGNVIIKNPEITNRLADIVGTAGLCILPTGYPEICSNSVLQALKSGTPIITTGNLGATQEWVKHRKNGMLTQFLPNDYMVYTVEMIKNAVEVLSNEKLHRKMINNAANTKILTWQRVGALWETLLK